MVNEDECYAAGLDPEKVQRLAARIGRAARDAQRMGIQIFGGTGSGSLRYNDGTGRMLIVADINGGSWSGGDGGDMHDADGLLRGE